MTTIAFYEKIAHYYDITHAALWADIPFACALAVEANGPILELGCGSGRLLLPLARAGVHVTGLDNSPAMLQRARQKLAAEPSAVRERVMLVEADMTAFDLPQRYALILLSYNTLMHLPPAEMKQALRMACHHLLPMGHLYIDLPNPLDLAQTPMDHLLTLERVFSDPETGEVVLQLASNLLDLDRQKLQVTWIYDATPPAGGTVQRLVTQVDFYYLYPHEMELLLSEVGMKLLALYGSYDRAPFTEEGERMLVIAGRIQSQTGSL